LWDTFLCGEASTDTDCIDEAHVFMSVTAVLTYGGWPRLDVHVSRTPNGSILTETELTTLGLEIHPFCHQFKATISTEYLSTLIEAGLIDPEEIISQAERECGEIQHFPEHPLPPQWERRVDAYGQSYFLNHEGKTLWWDPPPHVTTDDDGGENSEYLTNLACLLTPFPSVEWYCCPYHLSYPQDATEYSETDSDIDPDEYSDALSNSSPDPGDGTDSDAGDEDSASESEDGEDVFHDAEDGLT
jgi:hypothetical protein